jgi:hypothetical protein
LGDDDDQGDAQLRPVAARPTQRGSGTLTLDKGRGRLTTVLPSEPSVCRQVGHNSAIFLTLADGTVVLEGGAPWEVR